MLLRNIIKIGAVLASVVALNAYAGLSDVRVRENSGVTTVEITFDEKLTLRPALIDASVKEFVIELTRDKSQPDPAWSTSQLQIDESDNQISHVSLESIDATRVSLTVRLRDETYINILPQYLSNHVLFTLTQKKQHQQLSITGKQTQTGAHYVVTLESRLATVPTLADVPQTLAAEHTVYISPYQHESETWQRLRVGFFADRNDAIRARAQVLAHFPDAWIEKVSDQEMDYGQAYALNPNHIMDPEGVQADKDGQTPADIGVRVAAMTPSRMADTPQRATEKKVWTQPIVETHPLLEAADNAFRDKQYSQAIKLYTRVTEEAAGPVHEQALERLGIARELNGQLAQATKIYRSFLSQYPQSAAATAIQQRLDTLAALNSDVPAVLRKAKHNDAHWQNSVSISQFYRRHTLEIDGDRRVPINGIISDVDLITRRNGGALDHAGRASLTYLWDFTGALDDQKFQIGQAYWETYSNRLSTGLKIGRQSKHVAGVLGRFDGATLAHQFSNAVTVGLVGGSILESSFDMPNGDRPFFGAYGTYTSKSGALRLSPFVIQQQYEGLVDRQAVGLQGQYIRGNNHFMGMLDYDFHHAALNNVTLMAHIGVGKQSTFDVSIDQRRSPYVTTRNALIGQPFDDLSELENELINLSLKQLADDRSTTNTTLRLRWNTKFSSRWEVSGDVLASDVSSSKASMNVQEFEARQDLYYTLQIRALDVYGASSYSGITVRQTDSDLSSTQSIYWDNRITLGRQMTLQPRLRFDYRQFDTGNQTQTSIKPSLRLNYRWDRQIRFQLEAGYENTTRETNLDDFKVSGFFINAGYRATF